MILVDTLRADHLGLYGHPRNTSPFLDEIAARSIVFEDVVSAASATFPSVNSLFSSRDSALFFLTSSRDLGIPESMTTLAEVLQQHGYATAAVSASPIVRASPSELNPGGGFGQGFGSFDEACSDPRFRVPPYVAPCVTERAVAAIEQLPEQAPFFLYVHYLDPHDPYRAPADPEGFVGAYEGKQFIADGLTWPLVKWITRGEGENPGDMTRDVRHLMDLYDAEIRAADGELRRLVDALRDADRLDDTLLVFLSDHGESFLENGALQHSYSLYQTEIRVPLILHWPSRWSQGRRHADVVCSVDVFPTIVSLLGLEAPAGLSGRPVLDADGQAIGGERVCFSAARSSWHAGTRTLSSVRRGRWKLIHDHLDDDYRLFDLSRDPGERRNRAPGEEGEERAAFEQLSALLEERMEQAEPGSPSSPSDAVELSPEAARALRALGYIE